METRPLTDVERRYLEWHLAQESGPDPKQIVIGSCFGAGCLGFPVVAVGLIAGANARAIRSRPFWLGMAAVAVALWLFFVILGLLQRRTRASQRAEARGKIESDLTAGVAALHRFRASAVILAYGPKRRTRNYFVRLDDGRVLYLGAWTPPACPVKELSGAPDEKGFPSVEFDLATGPESRLMLDVVGRGDFLRPVDEFDLRKRTPKLIPGELIPTPWAELRATYG